MSTDEARIAAEKNAARGYDQETPPVISRKPKDSSDMKKSENSNAVEGLGKVIPLAVPVASTSKSSDAPTTSPEATGTDSKAPKTSGDKETEAPSASTTSPEATGTDPKAPKTEHEKKMRAIADIEEAHKKIQAGLDTREQELKKARAELVEAQEAMQDRRIMLELEGKRQNKKAKQDLTEIVGGTVGIEHPALKKLLDEAPAGLTAADAEKFVKNGIKDLVPKIAGNIVTSDPKNMTRPENERADVYAKELQDATGDIKAQVEKLKEREKRADDEKTQKDIAIQGAIKGVADKLPKEDQQETIKSYTRGVAALDDPNTSPDKINNIKSALGARPGDRVKDSKGNIFTITGQKEGKIVMEAVKKDPLTGGTIKQEVLNEDFLITQLEGDVSLADKYETTFGKNMPSAPVPAVTPPPAARPTAAAPAREPAPTVEVPVVPAAAPAPVPAVTPPTAAAAPAREPAPTVEVPVVPAAAPAPVPAAPADPKASPFKTPMTSEQRRKIATDAVLGSNITVPGYPSPSEQSRIDSYLKPTIKGTDSTPEEFEKWVLNNEFDRGPDSNITSRNRSARVEREAKERKDTSGSVATSKVPVGGEKPLMSPELKRNIAKDVMSYGQGGIQLPPESAKRMQEYVNSSPNNETRKDFISRIQIAESDITQKKFKASEEKSRSKQQTAASANPLPTATGSRPAETTPAPAKSADRNKRGVKSITIDRKITIGDFAAQNGTTFDRLKILNALDETIKETTLLAKGSELYVPTTPESSAADSEPVSKF